MTNNRCEKGKTHDRGKDCEKKVSKIEVIILKESNMNNWYDYSMD